MSFRKSPRAIRILLLAALVALPALPAHAAPGGSRLSGGGSILTALLDELSTVWNGFWSDSGCTIDPDGRMRSTQEREGVSIEPSGGTPEPGVGTDEGMLIDPHG
jgi:hypothetical protein